MKTPRSILAVLDRGPLDSTLVAKASRLASGFKARLELFICDAEHAYVLKHEYEPSHRDEFRRNCMARAIEYLVEVRGAAKLSETRTSVSAACESPLYEGIVHKVLQSRPDLVIKRAAGYQPGRAVFDPNDWQLMRKCPATLMMVRDREWRPRPRLAAAVDVSGEETAGLAASIVETAETLRSMEDGELDILYAERESASSVSGGAREAAVRNLAQACNVRGENVRILDGEPERALPAFAAKHDYDVLVMGALTHRPGAVALVGTLTSKLVDMIDCDFVLVKPGLED